MVTYQAIEEAYQQVKEFIYHSPCMMSKSLSLLTGSQVYLKLENLQMTGSFKERGALNKLRTLRPEELEKGVIAASAGNHAQGVAYHAHRLGSAATIVMPETTPLTKVISTRKHGANVILSGQSYDDAYDEAILRQHQDGYVFIHAFDDEKIIAGQGTIGMEIIDDGIEPDAVLVPIGGGGLISGISIAIKEQYPHCKIIGIQTMNAPAMKRSIDAGSILPMKPKASLADGIAVKSIGHRTFPIVQRYVDDIVLVDEEEIAAAILTLLENEKSLVEGAGAATYAALTYHDLNLKGKKVVLIMSGGNIDINILSRIIERGLIKDCRMSKLRIELLDTPGQLATVSELIGRHRANVMEVYHNRSFMNSGMGRTFMDITIETRGEDHLEEIVHALTERGYTVQTI